MMSLLEPVQQSVTEDDSDNASWSSHDLALEREGQEGEGCGGGGGSNGMTASGWCLGNLGEGEEKRG